jgi:hypothetical protein
VTFNSLEFFIFIPIVWLLYLYFAQARWVVLLIASLVFYSFFKSLSLILVISFVIAVTFFCGRGMSDPVAVSDYVFQAISYLVDIRLQRSEPERHAGYGGQFHETIRIIAEIAAQYQVAFVTEATYLSPHHDKFFDEDHLNSHGQQLLSALIATRVREVIKEQSYDVPGQ